MNTAPTTRLPQELWFIIIDYLGPFDALQLRSTCSAFNGIVKRHQTYWYRQFAWFLVVQNKWRAALFKTGCGRGHKSDIPRSAACLSHEQEVLVASIYQIGLEEVNNLVAQNPDTIKHLVCSNPLHYTYEIPKYRFNIPIVPADFHPKEQVYMYRFLIHNYRHRRDQAKRHTQNAASVKSQIKQVSTSIRKLEAESKKARKKLGSLKMLYNELVLLEKNDVFFGSKSRQYRSKVD